MKNPEIINIYPGDLSDIKNTRPDFPGLGATLDSNWHCYTRVNDCDGNEIIASHEITDKVLDTDSNERFQVALVPSKTELLEVPTGEKYQDYDWVIQLENMTLTPPFSKEHHITLRVKPQGIP